MKKLCLILGLFGSIYTLTMVFISAIASPNFSWTNNYLSDIGAGKFGFLPQLLFNSSLIIGGLAIATFFILVMPLFKKQLISKISLSIMFIGSVSLAMIGIFTEHAPYNLHLISSYGFFILLPLAMIIFSFTYFKKSLYFGVFTILMAFLGLGIILNMPLAGGKAIPEIGEAFVLSIWVAIFSVLKCTEKV